MSRARPIVIAGVLLIPVALALFPFGWLGLVVPGFGNWLDGVFFNDWVHALGHGTIFFILGLALLALFPALPKRLWLFYLCILLGGVGQEFFQLLFKRQLLVFDDSRDIVTDLVGATLAVIVVCYAWPKLTQSHLLAQSADTPGIQKTK